MKRPQPADLRLRHHRSWQGLRRLSLALSLVTLLGLPLWHLAAAQVASAGLAGGGGSAWLARVLGLSGARPPIAGAPGAINLFGLELLDPLAATGVLVAAGSVPVLSLLPVLLLVLLLGRFFCGWICPYVPLLGVSNALRSLLSRAGFTPPDLKLPRRTAFLGLGALLLATAIGGGQVALLVYPPALIGREAFRAVLFGGLGGGAAFVAAAFLFDTFVSRGGFCRTLCPGGALYATLSVASPLRIVRTASACTDCTACDVVCNLGQQPMTDRLDAGCERCGKCVSVCPTDALRLAIVAPWKRP